MDTTIEVQHAVMVRAQYSRFDAPRWITHAVFADALEAYIECGKLVTDGRFNESDVCVRLYHSHAWELLVR